LLGLGWICQGSLLHAPPHAWRWTRKVHAKTVTLALSEPQAELYRQAIANHRRLEQVLSEMRDLSQKVLSGSVPGVRRRPRKIDPKTPLS
jgi:hypothetical protein